MQNVRLALEGTVEQILKRSLSPSLSAIQKQPRQQSAVSSLELHANAEALHSGYSHDLPTAFFLLESATSNHAGLASKRCWLAGIAGGLEKES
eukprot:1152819-Pelagomonas_calceolata.AAC.1